MKEQLPPEAQRIYGEIEDLQDDAEDVVERREQAEDRLEDVRAAIDALEGVDEGTSAYRTVGPVRIESDPADLRDDLEAKVARLEDRIERLDATESDLREQFEERKRQIKHLLGAAGGPGSPAGRGPGGPSGPGAGGPGDHDSGPGDLDGGDR